MSPEAKSEILRRYREHVDRFEQAAESRRRLGLAPLEQDSVDAPAAGPQGGRLSPREHSVLTLIAAGLTDGQIGRHLAISEHTVKTHVKRVLVKLSARNRPHAVCRAFSTGALKVETA